MDLVTLGEVFEDLVFFDLPRVPRPGEELVTRSFARTSGGGALITAVAAARLGTRVTVAGGLDDGAVRLLRAERVHAVNLRRPGEPHAISVAISTAADRSFVTFAGMNDRLEDRVLALLPRLRARHVHLALRPRRPARWVRLLDRLRARGVTSSWDFGWHEDLPRARGFAALLGALDYVSVNEPEAMHYAGCATLARAARHFAGATRHTVIKRGARGARLVGSGIDLSVPARRVRVVDTVGAGDAFNGGFLHALLAGGALADCLRAGTAVGGASVRAAGGLAGLPRRRRRA